MRATAGEMKYTFGPNVVDAGPRTVSHAGAPVHLTRKAFDLLILLLEARPNAVTKDQIYERLWPDTFVSEASLQTLVHEMRQAIDGPSPERSWIRTVHGIGYRFDGEVSAIGAVRQDTTLGPAAWLCREAMRVALHRGENIVGRGVEDVVEIDLPTISRHHARLVIGESVTIEDLGSKNGTWVNDERVTESRVLADGDVVSLGSARFVFQLGRRPVSTESAELPPQS